jgi:DNA-binding response OmpR family regulator
VLVAEDNELVCGALRVLFEETGHRVTTTPSIVATVAAATGDRVDVLLLDLGLADGDGRAVLAQLGALGAMPAVTVALTGRDEPEVVAECLALGCREVLLKPVPARELLQRVRCCSACGAGSRNRGRATATATEKTEVAVPGPAQSYAASFTRSSQRASPRCMQVACSSAIRSP